jgi:dipeptidyl aminopeptidase/acylaminoacyl peptidase
VVGEQDAIAPPLIMERRFEALRKAGTEVEFHEFMNLGHGFGSGTGTSTEGWLAEFAFGKTKWSRQHRRSSN